MNEILKEKINIFLDRVEDFIDVEFAYIFGSYARGEENINSDIDIAIMPNLTGIDKMTELFTRGNLIEIGKEIFNRDVDIVFLNTDSVFLKYHIIQEGIVIRDDIGRSGFESLVLREYFDFKHYSDYYNEHMLNSIRSTE